MTELLFNIFGDATRQITNTPSEYKHTKNNDENIGIARSVGKGALDGPIKPQEGTKKSFLSNAGKPLQSTPVHQKTHQVFTAPTPIYSDVDPQQDWFEKLEFTKPRLYNYHIDIFQDNFEIGVESPERSPPPKTKDASMKFQQSYEYDLLTDNIQLDMDLVLEDDFPELY